MKLIWLGYLVYTLGNCAMKLCIETGLSRNCYELRTHNHECRERKRNPLHPRQRKEERSGHKPAAAQSNSPHFGVIRTCS